MGSVIRAFSISSALWVLGVLCAICWQSLSKRPQHIMVDGCHSKRLHCVRSVAGQSFGSVIVLLYTSKPFYNLEYMLIGYADDSTLMAVVPFSGVRVSVAESLIRDHGRVSVCCDHWGMILTASTTKTMIVSRSRTMHPQSPPINDCRTSADIYILEWHLISRWPLRSIFARFSEQLLSLLKDMVPWGSLGGYSTIYRFLMFSEFCPAHFGIQYCSAVSCSAAETHRKLLDRVGACFITKGVF